MNKETFFSDYEIARKLRESILDDASFASFSESDLFSIRLATEEAFANALKHGNKWDEKKKIEVSWELNKDKLSIIISDEGEGFDPKDVADPTAPENMDRPFGRGVMLIRAYMDEVFYNTKGNEITMIKSVRPAGV